MRLLAMNTFHNISNPDYFLDLSEEHDDVFIALTCGCSLLKVIVVDPRVLPSVEPVVIVGEGDISAVLYNRQVVTKLFDIVERSLVGSSLEDEHVQRAIGAIASDAVERYVHASKH